MGRWLALDYGLKRTGIAVTDPAQIIASPLTTVQTAELLDFLNGYFEKEQVDGVVIGYPRRLNNEATHATSDVEAFGKKLASKFPNMPIEWIDERFTSKMASQTIHQSGVNKKKKKDKGLTDKISATIILQSFLAQKQV